MDIGTGGGIPGIVVAILHRREDRTVRLVERDNRKAAFLRHVGRSLSLPIVVHADGVERLPPLRAAVLSARAMAPLDQLLAYGFRHLADGGTAYFLKGRSWREEVAIARQTWSFALKTSPSPDGDGVLLEIREIRHAGDAADPLRGQPEGRRR